MKTTKRYLLPLLALIALAGCTDDETTADPGLDVFRIEAAIDAPEGMNAWQAADEIKIVCNDELYTFAAAEDGSEGRFTDRDKRLSAQVIGNSAVSAFSNCTSMWGTFRIQAEQQANDGVVQARVPMFAYTMNSPEQECLKMSFKPLASLLELEVLPYDMTVSRLTITPAEEATVSGGAIAGGFTVNAAQSTVAINNAVNSISVDFNGGLNLSQGATFRIPIGWFAVEGGLTLTFSYGAKEYSATIWEEDGIVKTFTDNAGYKTARLIHQVFEFDANYFPRPYYVKADAPANGKGLTWDAPASLSSALRNAVAGSTLHIAAGTYIPEDLLTGAPESEGGKCFEITRNIALIGGYPADAAEGATANPAVNKTILEGAGTSFHTLVISAPKLTGEKVSVKGLTVTGGKNAAADNAVVEINGLKLFNNYAAGVAVMGACAEISNVTISGNESNNAAGVYALGADLTVADCVVKDNKSAANGGGMWVSEGSKITMSGTRVENNTAGGTAAGLYFYTAPGETLDVVVSTTAVKSNVCTSSGVSALYLRDESGNLGLRSSFTDCEFSGNKNSATGGMGGCINVYNTKTSFTGCRLQNNEAANNGVFAVNTDAKGSKAGALFDKCTVSGNKTTGNAAPAGIYVYNAVAGGAVEVLVTNSTFTDNVTAGRGGAIYARNAQAGSVNVTCVNSTFAGNRSGSFGSAIAMYGTATYPTEVALVSCTLTGNASTNAANAGAVGLETAGLTLKTYNTIISGNVAGPNAAVGDVIVKSGIAASVSHTNTIVGSDFYTAAGVKQATTPVFDATTMLSPLADNGGPTWTCKLVGNAAANYAVGNGMTATALKGLATADVAAETLSKDQTGAARSETEPVMGACVKK